MSDSTLVPGAHRRIRMLDSGAGPCRGSLVADGDEVRVSVDAAELRGGAVWRFAGADHVVAPLDLVRRPDGLDVLLLWCEERVTAYLGRRAAAEEPLTAGEAVTLAGSLLRGLAELGAEEGPGAWWLTHAGMPVFAFGEGAVPAAGASELLTLLDEGTPDRALRRVLSEIVRGLEDTRAARRHLERWEAALLELAAPRPLRRDPAHAEAVETVSTRRPASRAVSDARRRDGAGDRGGRPARAADALRARASAILGMATSRRRPAMSERRAIAGRASLRGRTATAATAPTAGASAGLRGRTASNGDRPRRTRRTPGDTRRGPEHPGPEGAHRRRLLMVGGAAAAVVLLGGVLWPADDGASPAVADPASAASSPRPSASVAPNVREDTEDITTGAGGGGPVDDPVAAAKTLIERIDSCRRENDQACSSGIAPDADEKVRAALSDAGDAEPLVLVESYGDVAVIKRGLRGGAQQLLVLARRKDEWLVRDVYDVADQPGS
ncbi:hypothetical protein [Microbacterium sp.]|uniref:hypothetical protein n=1 Tax=Microbacterium sp. TaxID=51671 RepID=UPI00333F81A1